MSKIEQTLRREDGSEVKIVATEFFGAGLHRSVGVYVLARANANENWRLANSGALPDWADMSIQDREKIDRSEIDRKSVVEGKSVAVSEDDGGRVNNKK